MHSPSQFLVSSRQYCNRANFESLLPPSHVCPRVYLAWYSDTCALTGLNYILFTAVVQTIYDSFGVMRSAKLSVDRHIMIASHNTAWQSNSTHQSRSTPSSCLLRMHTTTECHLSIWWCRAWTNKSRQIQSCRISEHYKVDPELTSVLVFVGVEISINLQLSIFRDSRKHSVTSAAAQPDFGQKTVENDQKIVFLVLSVEGKMRKYTDDAGRCRTSLRAFYGLHIHQTPNVKRWSARAAQSFWLVYCVLELANRCKNWGWGSPIRKWGKHPL